MSPRTQSVASFATRGEPCCVHLLFMLQCARVAGNLTRQRAWHGEGFRGPTGLRHLVGCRPVRKESSITAARNHARELAKAEEERIAVLERMAAKIAISEFIQRGGM